MLPACTGSGESVTVTDRSADAATVVVAVALLFPALLSPVVEVTVAVFESTVPLATAAPTLTVSVNTELPTAKLACVQETVPPRPTVGVAHDQPATVGIETNVVPAGNVSDQEADAAASGPLLVTVMV